MAPGSSAFEIARALGHSIEIVPRLPGNARGGVDPETCAILLASCSYQPRLEFTAAHELIEHAMGRRVDPEWHEAACQRGAAALLMPAEAFIPSALSCNMRLPALQRLWRHCSAEALLTRMGVQFPGCAASSWRGPVLKFRRGAPRSQELLDLEAFVAAEVAASGRESWIRERGIGVRAWPAGSGRALALSVAA